MKTDFGESARSRCCEALTRIELLAILGAVCLLALIAAPLAANTRTRTERLVCVSNLGHIGRAYQRWASDHGDRNPFLVPMQEGGLNGHPLARNIWVQYAWLSNELATPKVLACPSDSATRVGLDFTASPNGGFLNGAYRNNAVSYFVGLHTFFNNPRSILAGDRNVRMDFFGGGCSYASLTAVAGIAVRPIVTLWEDGIHSPAGNLLFNDTHVLEASTSGLRQALIPPLSNFESSFHLILPR